MFDALTALMKLRRSSWKSVLGRIEDESSGEKRRVAQRVTNFVTDSLGESNDLHSRSPKSDALLSCCHTSMMAGYVGVVVEEAGGLLGVGFCASS
jgi:hypothetical protein